LESLHYSSCPGFVLFAISVVRPTKHNFLLKFISNLKNP
jgi:hypothetical protein